MRCSETDKVVAIDDRVMMMMLWQIVMGLLLIITRKRVLFLRVATENRYIVASSMAETRCRCWSYSDRPKWSVVLVILVLERVWFQSCCF